VRPVAKPEAWLSEVLDKIQRPAAILGGIAGMAAGLTFVYLLYGAFAGYLVAVTLYPDAYAHAAHNLALALRFFWISSLVALVCLTLAYVDSLTYYVLSALVGVALVMLPSLVIAGQFYRAGLMHQGPLAFALGHAFVYIGGLVLGVAILRGLFEAIASVRLRLLAKAEAPQQVEQAPAETKGTGKRPFWHFLWLRPCWEMPYCKDYAREVCPAYARRKSCWRLKKGCLCDPDFITRLLEKGTVVAKGQNREDVAKRWLEAEAKERAATGKAKPDCKHCVIYLQHQREKFQLASVLVVPALILGLWLLRNSLFLAYERGVFLAARLVGAISLGDSTHVLEQVARVLLDPPVPTLAVLLGVLFIITLVFKLVEYLILELKL